MPGKMGTDRRWPGIRELLIHFYTRRRELPWCSIHFYSIPALRVLPPPRDNNNKGNILHSI